MFILIFLVFSPPPSLSVSLFLFLRQGLVGLRLASNSWWGWAWPWSSDPPVFFPQVLGSKVCTTPPSMLLAFKKGWNQSRFPKVSPIVGSQGKSNGFLLASQRLQPVNGSKSQISLGETSFCLKVSFQWWVWAYVCVWSCAQQLVLAEDRGEMSHLLKPDPQAAFKHQTWMLGNEPRVSEEAVSVIDSWTMSPAWRAHSFTNRMCFHSSNPHCYLFDVGSCICLLARKQRKAERYDSTTFKKLIKEAERTLEDWLTAHLGLPSYIKAQELGNWIEVFRERLPIRLKGEGVAWEGASHGWCWSL